MQQQRCCFRNGLPTPLQVLTFERLPAPTPLHSEGVLPPLPIVPKGHPFPALAALSRLEVSLRFAQMASSAVLCPKWACRLAMPLCFRVLGSLPAGCGISANKFATMLSDVTIC
jgi:hypothetical protein